MHKANMPIEKFLNNIDNEKYYIQSFTNVLKITKRTLDDIAKMP